MTEIQDRKEETKAVRKALKAVGINGRVSHGRGTAWGWLKVNIGEGQQWGEHDRGAEGNRGLCNGACQRCKNTKAMREQTQAIIREVTGRDGEHNGNTLVLTQDHWSESKGQSVPIEHPNWTRSKC